MKQINGGKGKNRALLLWFNGMEIESARYAVNSFLDNDKFNATETEKIELEQIENKFDHKIENFEAHDGLKINLTVSEINKLRKVITEEIERERERNNALMKELLLTKKNTKEYSEKEQQFSIMTYYHNQLIEINKKLSNRVVR